MINSFLVVLLINKRRYVSGNVTEDDNYLIVTGAIYTKGNDMYIKDLSNPNSKLINMVDNFDNDSYVLDNIGSKLYIVTNLNAPNQKIVTVDAANPKMESWKDFIPETTNVLSPSTGGGFIFTEYMVDAISKVYQYDMNGKQLREIELPGIGSVGGFGGKREAEELYFSFSNYINPTTIYKFDLKTANYEVYKKPSIDFDNTNYESKQVFYTSKDSTKVPMIITYKKRD